MEEDKIFEKMKELLISTCQIEAHKINKQSTFKELELDSLDAVALMGDLEEELGIQVPNEDILNISSIREGIDIILKIQNS